MYKTTSLALVIAIHYNARDIMKYTICDAT